MQQLIVVSMIYPTATIMFDTACKMSHKQILSIMCWGSESTIPTFSPCPFLRTLSTPHFWVGEYRLGPPRGLANMRDPRPRAHVGPIVDRPKEACGQALPPLCLISVKRSWAHNFSVWTFLKDAPSPIVRTFGRFQRATQDSF